MIPIGFHTMFNYHQVLTYNEWDEQQLKIAMEIQGVKKAENIKLDGAAGLRTFSFTPKGSLLINRVKNNVTGSILDLTNYE